MGNEIRLPSLASNPPKRLRAVDNPDRELPAWIPSENRMERVCLELMEAAGMSEGYRPNGTCFNTLKLRTTGPRKCVFGPTHDSNSAAIIYQRDGSVEYACHASSCSGKRHKLGVWRIDTLEQLATGDLLTDAQLREFDPGYIKAMEEKCLAGAPSAKAKLEECPGYPIFYKAAMAYFNRFFAHVLCSTPEVVQVRTGLWVGLPARGSGRTRLAWAPPSECPGQHPNIAPKVR